jgi:protein involved in polysaccharide export with SLBB domain
MNNCRRFQHLCIVIGLAIFISNTTVAQQVEPPDESYKVLPGDMLRISVWGQENLDDEVLVKPIGNRTSGRHHGAIEPVYFGPRGYS